MGLVYISIIPFSGGEADSLKCGFSVGFVFVLFGCCLVLVFFNRAILH